MNVFFRNPDDNSFSDHTPNLTQEEIVLMNQKVNETNPNPGQEPPEVILIVGNEDEKKNTLGEILVAIDVKEKYNTETIRQAIQPNLTTIN